MLDPKLKEIILKTVETQLRDMDPPETKETYNRLIALKYSDEIAREMIGAVVVSEIIEIFQQGKPFNRKRYIEALCNLPELPK